MRFLLFVVGVFFFIATFNGFQLALAEKSMQQSCYVAQLLHAEDSEKCMHACVKQMLIFVTILP